MNEITSIKQRFGIIGQSPLIDRAIDVARQVAPTDLTVLITGESGTGKEVFPKIIHQFSARKHGPFIAVNCGAIPEGTIDSELFGHEKGSFTGATDARKGYFEVVNGGTIFLDEVAELPLSTQVRLLRVLESGEFFRVGSSKVIKTDARVVAATNVKLGEAIANGKFREDLFYRLNTVPIHIPPLRERKEDIALLFRKFAADFAEKYRMPALVLSDEAQNMLRQHYWSGNVRQLKNVTEQISIIEQAREVTVNTLSKYLNDSNPSMLPVLQRHFENSDEHANERELLYKVLFDMKKDMAEMKKLISEIISATGIDPSMPGRTISAVDGIPIQPEFFKPQYNAPSQEFQHTRDTINEIPIDYSEEVEESLSLEKKEKEIITKALEKHHSRRKNAAAELGISERTLYRKIKEYGIE
ncbi:MAG: sigma-54-dependent Fis family transcriptional regulator [Bacteroidetes bacterium GWF2_43_63]|nr:MAG: sigma-54-dependent Fis family transcriptional regulator [Bacteroidetes bacterium GWE2_42_42]OFY54075.1 MAG: sigma-54-dependent Fis family transcriptional regulator [Bacteroidetes bacterium GWF2_43_63]HBG69716.1 sigma-54-dependent Fis family transcriptional regulator [Bacteroidales bacterium]HCB61092.1 sigma-54-dependent Fis family transcriptional regulator [Bacteroidales bacterium]HCY23392.1 sigma-54-dependent Fis family transcriptional regulator [Bacteroidales bacterium]